VQLAEAPHGRLAHPLDVQGVAADLGSQVGSLHSLAGEALAEPLHVAPAHGDASRLPVDHVLAADGVGGVVRGDAHAGEDPQPAGGVHRPGHDVGQALLGGVELVLEKLLPLGVGLVGVGVRQAAEVLDTSPA
jgi:hypothetical protein